MPDVIIQIRDQRILNKHVLDNFFDNLGDGRYLITSKSLNRRTLPQNSYLHLLFGLLVEPLRDAGWNNVRTIEDAKEFVKKLFLTVKEVNEKTGDVMERVRGTSELTKMEMIDFIDDVKQWSSEYLSTYLPDAGEAIPMFKTN